ncbi:MAG: hypothetical protein IT459_12380 [Planctomycetes bacterium]|nr:hypothetical protein [Planctomycetota bacterium]
MRHTILVAVLALLVACSRGPDEPEEVPFTELRAHLNAGRIERITIRGTHYTWTRQVGERRAHRESHGPQVTDGLSEELLRHNVRVTYEREE